MTDRTVASVPPGSEGTIRAVGGAGLAPEKLVQVAADLYERLDELARGGLGRISRARDLRSGRLVAIKEMLADSPDAAARFAREAMITANLQHPAIVPVYEVGRWPSGEPFYAMKLVNGRPLSAVIEAAGELDARLALVSHVVTVADALAYAHGERVIHRDLKPHNVLCGAFGETVVIDWGLARRLDDADDDAPAESDGGGGDDARTRIGAVLGTPAYMPPEQARGELVDERADVYAIGAILYHVLTGRPAHVGATAEELIEAAAEHAPAPLTGLVPEAPRDLVAIVERAMAPRREDRYPSAAELATDLRRFMTGGLVRAYHYTAWQRLGRFVKRHRAAVTVGAIAVVALTVGGTLAIANIVRARDAARAEQQRAEVERQRADRERDAANKQLVAVHTERARFELGAHHPTRALSSVVSAAEVGGLDPTLRYLAARALDGIAPGRSFSALDIASVEFVPGSHDLLVNADYSVVRWDPETDRRVWVRRAFPSSLVPLDARTVLVPAFRTLAIVDVQTGQDLRTIATPSTSSTIGFAAADRSKRWIAIGGFEATELFDLQAGVHVATIPVVVGAPPVVSADGQRLVVVHAAAIGRPSISLIDRSGRDVKKLCDECIAASETRAGFAVAEQHRVVLYDWSGAVVRTIVPQSRAEIITVGESPDGAMIVVGLSDGSIEAYGMELIWRASAGEPATRLAFDTRGRVWVVGQYAGTHLYDLATGVELSRREIGGEGIRVSDDGREVAVGAINSLRAWGVDPVTFTAVAPTDARVRRVAFHGPRVITASDDGTIAVLDPGAAPREIGHHAGHILSLQVLRDGSVLTASRDNTVVIRDGETGRELERYPDGILAALSPDETLLAIGSADGVVTLVDRRAKTRRELERMDDEEQMAALHWTPDGSKLVGASIVGAMRAWTPDGKRVWATPELGDTIDLVLSRDGRHVVPQMEWSFAIGYAIGAGRDVRLDDKDHAREYATGVAFSPDGTRVAIAELGHIRIWSWPDGALQTTLASPVQTTALVFSRDGTLLYSGGADRKVRVWSVPDGVMQTEVETVSEVYGLAFDETGERLAILTLGAAEVWTLGASTLDLPALRALATPGTRR